MRNRFEVFRKGKTIEERRNEYKNYILAAMAMLTAWIIAIWQKLLSVINVDVNFLQIGLIVVTAGFFFLLYLYNKI